MNATPRPGHARPEALARAVRERGPITIRPATPDDLDAVRRLAALATRAVPRGPLTVVETEDGIVAALGHDGIVADPFRATEDLVELLALRAAQIAA